MLTLLNPTLLNTTLLNPTFFEDDQWGQFIDIENHQLFPKQIIHYVTTIKTESTTVKTTPSQPLKSILKKPIETQPKVQNQNQNQNQNQKTLIKDEENDYRFQEFVERQLYVGWLICVLTFGFCLLP